jgi:hypothetical protein
MQENIINIYPRPTLEDSGTRRPHHDEGIEPLLPQQELFCSVHQYVARHRRLVDLPETEELSAFPPGNEAYAVMGKKRDDLRRMASGRGRIGSGKEGNGVMRSKRVARGRRQPTRVRWITPRMVMDERNMTMNQTSQSTRRPHLP